VRDKILQSLAVGCVVALGLVFQPLGFAAKNASALTPSPPAGFTMQTVVSGLNLPTSFAFTPDGRIFIAEKSGVIRVVKNGTLLPTPLLDISGEVNNYWDRGLSGMVLDPNFATNGYIYLSYPYDPTPTDDSGGKTGRLSRFTVVGDTASPSTEHVVLGTEVGTACSQFPVGSDCIPEEWYGHSVGDLHFGTDGSLFLMIGDAASWNDVSDDALRAQNLDSLAGKIVRVNPTTGLGYADNPYYDGDATHARSKVWAYGLRNAYRYTVRPGTPSPGTIFAGDVGWGTTEEVNVVAPKGANFGWPCYEGNAVQPGYEPKAVCQSLYAAVAQDPTKWVKPIIAYDHNGQSSAVTGGPFYTGTTYPAQYQGAYFFGDYARNQIRYATINSSNVVTSGPTDFDPTADSPVNIQVGPDGNLYYIAIVPGELRKYVYGSGPQTGGYLSDLQWTSASNGWGPVERDKSNGEQAAGDGTTITLNGTTYAKGLGTHAAADIHYQVTGCTTFQSDVGLDDEVGVNGSVIFQVYLDGTKTYDSGVMTGSTPTKQINLDLTGKSDLRLVVTNGGDSFDYDHADWAGARITCSNTFAVTSVSPTDGASGVAASTNVTATFSADINQSTLTSSTMTLSQGATSVPAALSYNATTRTATLDPNADLQAGQTYTATVVGGAGGVKDTAGNTLAASKTWTFTVASGGGGGGTTSYLSDLTWTSASNGWGPVEKDLSNGEQGTGDGKTITLNGTTYTKGLGTHAAADIKYALSGCTSFQSDVGVDDEVGVNGSVVFQVYLDGAKTYDSGVMTGSTPTKQINLDLTGKGQLEIVVTNAGDSFDFDHADWAGARITCGSSGGNRPPVVTISSPTAATTFAVGDVITFSGSATDPEDGSLPASSLSWQINIQHCIGTSCHIHFFMTVPGSGGTFTVPDHGDMFHFDLTLTATDSSGLSTSSTVSIFPRTINLTLATNPTGLQVVEGGIQSTAPYTTTQVQGATVTIYAPSPQGAQTFVSWSDGGAQQHNVTLGTTNATYTATFSGAPPFSVTAVSPADAATGVAASTNVTASFSADVNQSMLTSSTFSLKQGSTTVPAAVSYNAATRTATLDPTTNLLAGQTYTATVVGGAAGVKDTSGNALATSKVWTFTVASAGGGTTRYLSDLTWTSATNGWGPVEKDMSNGGQAAGDGNTITLNGVTYSKGLGSHAAADIRYALSGCTTFQADIGVDDEVGINGSVVFQVYLDKKKVYDSGVMTGASATKQINLSVAGKSQLRLVVTNGGDNVDFDHADWANARITCLP
jgi:glucose/arabinose dehydrogenase